MIGFALTNDLRFEREDAEIEPGTLYVDAICTNTDVRHLPHDGVKGAGQLLLDQIIPTYRPRTFGPHLENSDNISSKSIKAEA